MEGGLGFADALQHIEKAKVGLCYVGVLATLSSQVSCQQGLIELDLGALFCYSLNDAETFLTLLQNCNENTSFCQIKIRIYEVEPFF